MVDLIPQPRRLRSEGAPFPVRALRPEPLPSGLDRYAPFIDELLHEVGTGGSGALLRLRWLREESPPEGYRLEVSRDGVLVRAGDGLGALHAVRTLIDAWDATQAGTLPQLLVEDWPSFTVRGVFVESFSGPDRMSLADWRELVDRFGQLKLNMLGISLYGCWDLRHDGDRSEFLFARLRDFPQLQTPHTLTTWDPDQGRETSEVYLPRMFAEDCFGDVVAYARSRGVEVLPVFGGPGHSTLIPRLVPELSAVDDDGTATGYGYCVTRPVAVAVLRRLIRNLANQHLRPAGLGRLLCGGDEFYPIRNVDPDDRGRLVSPYCRCATCRSLSPGDLLIEYFMVVGRELADAGIQMVHWHDTLVREGVLDRYLRRAEKEVLPAPVVAWWRYSDPVPDVIARSETWVTPTTGIFASLFHQDFTLNIESMVREGARAGARGVLAYNVPDAADHRNFACLADLSWNLEGSGGAAGFKTRWAVYIAPTAEDRMGHAQAVGDAVYSCYPLVLYLVDHLLPYFATSAAGTTRFPDDLIRSLAVVQPALLSVLVQVRDTLRESVRLLPPTRSVRHWPRPGDSWRTESLRVADHVDLFLGLIETARRVGGLDQTELDSAVMDLERRGRELLAFVAASKPPYLAPAVLREHWGLVREIRPTLERLASSPESRPRASETWHAWLV